MLEIRKFEFVLRAEQPLAHAQESYGNTSVVMRRKVRQPDGSFANVPVITGDTMRHGLREASSYALLDAAGMLGDPDLSEAACRLLFAGGMVTGSAGGAVKLSDYREMVELVPPLALLGGCAQNRVIPGRLYVDDAVLICEEQRHMLCDWALSVAESDGAELQSCRAHLEEATRVRMDPMLDPGKRNLLTAGERETVERRQLASENASELDDVVEKDRNKSTMLPRSFERVVQGSLFYWSVTAQCMSPLDVDTFFTMCAAFLANARVGGKKATGHGRIVAIQGRDVTLLRPAETISTIEPKELGSRAGAIFRAHVTERAARIKDFLSQVAA